MAQSGRKSDKRETFALQVALGKSIRDAARTAGVSERTAYRWNKVDEFRQRVDEIRAELVQQTIDALVSVATKAVACLESLLDGGAATTKVAAARAILEMGLRYKELELERRICKLEAEQTARAGLSKLTDNELDSMIRAAGAA